MQDVDDVNEVRMSPPDRLHDLGGDTKHKLDEYEDDDDQPDDIVTLTLVGILLCRYSLGDEGGKRSDEGGK